MSGRNLDQELLKFEQEISKLNTETPSTSNRSHIISAAPVSSLSVSKSTTSAFMLPTFTPVAPNLNPYYTPPLVISKPVSLVKPVQIPASTLAFKPQQIKSDPHAIKRDSSGNSKLSDVSAAYIKMKKRKLIRAAGGQTWEDPSLNEWDPDDYRLFCGDLGNEVGDELLTRAFQKYPSFQKAKVVRDKRTQKTKGFGFVSFKNSDDFIKAMREMDGKYVGNRPIKLRKSNWRDRNLETVKKKEMEKQKMGYK